MSIKTEKQWFEKLTKRELVRTSEINVETIKGARWERNHYNMYAQINGDLGVTEIFLSMKICCGAEPVWWCLKGNEENNGARMTSFETFTSLGIEVDMSEIADAVLQKDQELKEIKRKEEEEKVREHRANVWDNSILINTLKPLLESKPREYTVTINTTKDEYVNSNFREITLIVNDVCHAFFNFDSKFMVTKNYSNNKIQDIRVDDKTTRSAKIEKMATAVDEFINSVNAFLESKKAKEENKNEAQQELEALLGVALKADKKSTGHHDHRGRWVPGDDYYTFSPAVETAAKHITFHKTRAYDSKNKKYVDAYQVQLPYIATPAKLKAIFDLFNK